MIYHYSAFVYLQPGVRADIDGIAHMKKPITDMEGYQHLKDMIAAANDKDGQGVDTSKLTIVSLSVLQP